MFPTRGRPVVYVPVLDCLVGRDPNRLLLLPLPYVFEYYSGLILRGSVAVNAHIWETVIMTFFVSVHIYLLAAAGDGVFIKKGPTFVSLADGLGVLVLMSDSFARCIDDIPFFLIVCTTGLTLCWPMSRFILGKSLIGPALSSKILSLCFDGVRGR